MLSLLVALALLGPLFLSSDPYTQELSARLTPPVWIEGGSWEYPLGTDHLGRDYLTRLLYGARISILIGLSAALVSGFIGTFLGAMAGYFGGRVDSVVMFVVTARLSMPIVLVALALVAVHRPSLYSVMAVLGLLLWDRFALVARSTTQQIVSSEYIVAARAQGCSAIQILLWEIWPNIRNNVVVVAIFECSHAIMLEAGLSFLGLGVPPPTPTWGVMIAEAKSYLLFEPWLIIIPGICLFALILSVNLVGEGLRRRGGGDV
jgi:peptide/nickel transport system permease protein